MVAATPFELAGEIRLSEPHQRDYVYLRLEGTYKGIVAWKQVYIYLNSIDLTLLRSVTDSTIKDFMRENRSYLVDWLSDVALTEQECDRQYILWPVTRVHKIRKAPIASKTRKRRNDETDVFADFIADVKQAAKKHKVNGMVSCP